HHQQDQHEREVEAREQRGVDEREDREQHAAAQDQPDLVAVPDRPDAVEEPAPLLVRAGKRHVEDADAHVEAIEDEVTGDDQDEQDVPDIGQAHDASSLTSARSRRRKISRNVSGRLDTSTVSTSSSGSGPTWILAVVGKKKRTKSQD